MTHTISHFMVIDDDPISNHICKKLIELTFPLAYIQTFTRPEVAISYIIGNSGSGIESNYTTVLLLDINMPAMSGWEVLKRMVEVPAVKERFKIFLCSSSSDVCERKNILDAGIISGFIEKPLFAATLREMFQL